MIQACRLKPAFSEERSDGLKNKRTSASPYPCQRASWQIFGSVVPSKCHDIIEHSLREIDHVFLPKAEERAEIEKLRREVEALKKVISNLAIANSILKEANEILRKKIDHTSMDQIAKEVIT